MTTALLAVDVQRDFTEGGALACSGGKLVARLIARLISQNTYSLTLSSQDWHTPGEDNGGHFAQGEPNFTTTWPHHCVAATPGAAYQEPLKASHFTYRVLKGQGKPAYSAFEGTEATTGEALASLLRRRGVTHLVLVGIALDYCVKATALDAVREGFTVEVLPEACAWVDRKNRAAVEAELREAGVKFSRLSFIAGREGS